MGYKLKTALLTVLFLCGLLFIVPEHRGVTIGDHLFHSIGLSPWSQEGGLGFHWSVIVGLAWSIASGAALINHLKIRFRSAARIVVIGAIVSIFTSPAISYWVMQAAHYNQTGLSVVDYTMKDASCSFQSTDGSVVYDCKITLMNYGRSPELVEIKPVFPAELANPGIVIQEQTVMLPERSRRQYQITFTSLPIDINTSGGFSDFGVIFSQDGEKRSLYWK